MIDIHTHILPNVDDGSRSVEKSIELLKQAEGQGVTHLFLTPHYRLGYKTDRNIIEKEFINFQKIAKDAGINVKLFLGQEIFVDREYYKVLKDELVNTMNNTKYVLVEFDYFIDTDISEVVYELVALGYIPIVAHFERYVYATIQDAYEVKELGGLIQVNADSIVGNNRLHRKTAKKLLKNNLVDFVASDVHDCRVNLLGQAKAYVTKKFGEKISQKLFVENAENLIKG